MATGKERAAATIREWVRGDMSVIHLGGFREGARLLVRPAELDTDEELLAGDRLPLRPIQYYVDNGYEPFTWEEVYGREPGPQMAEWWQAEWYRRRQQRLALLPTSEQEGAE
jgi:hypothetical protein